MSQSDFSPMGETKDSDRMLTLCCIDIRLAFDILSAAYLSGSKGDNPNGEQSPTDRSSVPMSFTRTEHSSSATVMHVVFQVHVRF